MSRHVDRIGGIVAAFEKSLADFRESLEALDEDSATRAPAGGGWTPAQIGAHVAIVNAQLAGIFTGQLPLAQIAPEDFKETAWSEMNIPDRIETSARSQPPEQVTREQALEQLATSAAVFVEAVRGVSHERAKLYTVRMPFGTLTLYQLGEFAAAHNHRHHAQLQRAASHAPA